MGHKKKKRGTESPRARIKRRGKLEGSRGVEEAAFSGFEKRSGSEKGGSVGGCHTPNTTESSTCPHAKMRLLNSTPFGDVQAQRGDTLICQLGLCIGGGDWVTTTGQSNTSLNDLPKAQKRALVNQILADGKTPSANQRENSRIRETLGERRKRGLRQVQFSIPGLSGLPRENGTQPKFNCFA